jgi:hypothetical protein
MNKNELFLKIARRYCHGMTERDRITIENYVRHCKFQSIAEYPTLPASAMRDGVQCVTKRQLAKLSGGAEYLAAYAAADRVNAEYRELMYYIADDDD